METTMIQLKKKTVARLQELKRYSRESYDEVINQLLDDSEVEVLTEKEIKEVEEGLEDIKQGRVQSIEKVAKNLNVKL